MVCMELFFACLHLLLSRGCPAAWLARLASLSFRPALRSVRQNESHVITISGFGDGKNIGTLFFWFLRCGYRRSPCDAAESNGGSLRHAIISHGRSCGGPTHDSTSDANRTQESHLPKSRRHAPSTLSFSGISARSCAWRSASKALEMAAG